MNPDSGGTGPRRAGPVQADPAGASLAAAAVTGADPAGASLVHVLPGAFAALGLPARADPIRLAERLAGVRRIAVLLVDGLGYHLLPAAAPAAPVLRDVLAGRLGTLIELRSTFPSTTPTSLVSLGTGTAPGIHGVLGFTVRVPGTDRVLVHVEWADDPPPGEWQPVPTQFERAAAAGIRVEVLGRPAFAGSGLTVAAYRGARYRGVPDDALADQMLAALDAGPQPALIFGYYPGLDSAAHLYGIDSAQWRAEAAAVGRLIDTLAGRLPRDAALLVTADHGGVDVPSDHRFDCDADPRLSAGLITVAGEPRVRHVYTRPGAAAEVRAAWQAVLGAAADVVSREEAVAAGWFGPVAARNLPRIGDVVVVCRDRYVVLASGHERAGVGRLVAHHGALTPVETAVPLLVYSGQ